MERKHYDFVIEEETMKGLRVFIVNKQGDFKKGDISKWIGIAINNLVRGYNAQQHYAKNSLESKDEIWKVRQAWQGIVKYLLDKYGFHLEKGATLPSKMYIEAVSQTRGTEKRTLDKWTRLFIEGQYFKKISIGAYEILDSCYEFDSDIAQISDKAKEELK